MPGYRAGLLGLMLAALISMLAAPLASAALPNGRAYELVSPVKKNGNFAGSQGYESVMYGLSSPSGDRVFYGVTGPVAGGSRGIQHYGLSDRDGTGWSTVDPMPYRPGQITFLNFQRQDLQASADLSRFSFGMSGGGLVPGNPVTNTGGISETAGALYVTEPGVGTTWLTEPTTSSPIPAVGNTQWDQMHTVGYSPDLSTFYFSYTGTLVPEDASRLPNVVEYPPPAFVYSPRGLYRWSAGELINYGSLPDGSFDEFGAIPAGGAPVRTEGSTMTSGTFNNQVSADGDQAIFVSPDPSLFSESGRVSQLYVRTGDAASVLVSKSEVTGLPAASGPLKTNQRSPSIGSSNWAYAYGSEDGSKIYFRSIDALTADAPIGSAPKAYLFDVASKDLKYLPGVRGMPIAAAPDLSTFIYGQSDHSGFDKGWVGLWNGAVAEDFAESTSGRRYVVNGLSTADGNVLLFQSGVALPGFNSGGLEQVYRYDVTGDQMTCVSCPPVPIVPTSGAHLSHAETSSPQTNPEGHLRGPRSISADASRVFFDTGDPLVNEDGNGQRDVYMWENGKVSLISSGRSDRESYFLDNSESGDDVFFITSENLVPEDRDGGYDVYDARVGGGFSIEPPPAPCVGAGCQPQESSPRFSDPGSVGFDGSGNARPRSKKPKCAKGKVRKQGKCVKQQQRKKQTKHKRAANTKRGNGK